MFHSDIGDDEIDRRIAEFRTSAANGLSDEECSNQLMSVFGGHFGFGVQETHYAPNTVFFRARAIPADEIASPFKTISRLSDAWEPPAQYVKTQGRLNAVGQSVLYCCPRDMNLALEEAGAFHAKFAAVMVYRSVKIVNVGTIGNYQNSGMSRDPRTQKFFEFLEGEFGREVQIGREGEYSITRIIADSFFNYPEQDAWCYRSVKSKSKFNCAFLPGRAAKSLKLLGVLIGEIQRAMREPAFKIKEVVDFDPVTNLARYHALGSPEQKQIFPHI